MEAAVRTPDAHAPPAKKPRAAPGREAAAPPAAAAGGLSSSQRAQAAIAAAAGLAPAKAGDAAAAEPLPPCPCSADVGLQIPLGADGKVAVSAEERAVLEGFKAFLRIRTVSAEGAASGAYAEAVALLRSVAEGIGLDTEVTERVCGKPVLRCTLPGSDPSLPSLLINSHYDVVPSFPDKWHSEPFEARETACGDIYARGTQDMKCVCIQHLEAVRQLKARDTPLLRTVHLTFVPDEEIGGADGMGAFVKTDAFKRLNVGAALDEGLARPDDAFTVFYGERAVWQCRVESRGPTGHASRFVPQSAVEKLLRVLSRIQAFRAEEEARLAAGAHVCGRCRTLGDVTSINVTMLDAGVRTSVDAESGQQNYALNVVPEVARAAFDTRVPPSVPMSEYKARIDGWCAEEGVSWAWEQCTPKHAVSSTDPSSSPWWRAFTEAVPGCVPEVFPAGTDSRYLRQLGVPAFGFSPMKRTPILLHDHDEFINARVFLDGIPVFVRLISALAAVPPGA